MNLLLEEFKDIPHDAKGGAVTIGNFDGVHRGHRVIMQQLRQMADRVHGPAIVFTFDPPPARLLRPEEAPVALTDLNRRAAILLEFGIDFVLVFRTTKKLLQLEPEDFFEQLIRDSLQCKAIAEGENFRFGRNRRGDVAMLKQLCQQANVQFSTIQPVMEDGQWVSSSRIRTLIEAGDVRSANSLLVEPYRVTGKVTQGDQRGRTLGFPTANLSDIQVLCPPEGVYAGRVAEGVAKGKTAAVNVGSNPTFGVADKKVEAHIVDFEGSLYGQAISIELLDRLRDVRKFASKDELISQLEKDISHCKEVGAQFQPIS